LRIIFLEVETQSRWVCVAAFALGGLCGKLVIILGVLGWVVAREVVWGVIWLARDHGAHDRGSRRDGMVGLAGDHGVDSGGSGCNRFEVA
jgi:hypothetical protein